MNLALRHCAGERALGIRYRETNFMMYCGACDRSVLGLVGLPPKLGMQMGQIATRFSPGSV